MVTSIGCGARTSVVSPTFRSPRSAVAASRTTSSAAAGARPADRWNEQVGIVDPVRSDGRRTKPTDGLATRTENLGDPLDGHGSSIDTVDPLDGFEDRLVQPTALGLVVAADDDRPQPVSIGIGAGQIHRQGDVLQRRQGGQQIERLEDESDVLTTNPGQFSIRQVLRSTSPMKTFPELSESRPARQCINVLLPDPDGPITAVKRPAAMSRLTLSSARTCVPLWPYTLVGHARHGRPGGSDSRSCWSVGSAGGSSASSSGILRRSSAHGMRRALRRYGHQAWATRERAGVCEVGCSLPLIGGRRATVRHRRSSEGGSPCPVHCCRRRPAPRLCRC